MELLRASEPIVPGDSKTYRRHRFAVPASARGLEVRFAYDRGGDLPHSLLTLSLFDPFGFRGAGHRFAPRQQVHVGPGGATPGFVCGPLFPGEWTVEVDLHCVIADGRYEIVVEASSEVSEERSAGSDPATETDVARAPTARRPSLARLFAGELHLHSTHSDGRWTVEEIAEAARARPVDFMFLTDHNTVTGVSALRRAVAGRIPVHAGQEMTTFRGHALALGLAEWLDWRAGLDGRTIDDVARAVRAAGGVMIVAHPDAPPDPICTGCQWTHADFDPALADGVEVWGGLWDGPEERNQGCLDLWRRWLNDGHRLAATGATDAHRHEDWLGAVPLTYVRADDLSLESILAAIRAGRTFVSSGPFLDLRVDEEGGVAAIGDTARAPRSIEASCAGAPSAELRIIVGGETRTRAEVAGDGQATAVPRAGDRWCCAELWNGDVLLAVTSPIYLRPGPSSPLD
jgi:hypothetical protein